MFSASRNINQTHPARVEEGEAHELQPMSQQSTASANSEINSPADATMVLREANQQRLARGGGTNRKLLLAGAVYSMVSFGLGTGATVLAKDAAFKLNHNPNDFPGQIPGEPAQSCTTPLREETECSGLKNKDIAKVEIGLSAALFGVTAATGYMAYSTLSGA